MNLTIILIILIVLILLLSRIKKAIRYRLKNNTKKRRKWRNKNVIRENPKTKKIKVLTNKKVVDMLFEDDDIKYYQNLNKSNKNNLFTHGLNNDIQFTNLNQNTVNINNNNVTQNMLNTDTVNQNVLNTDTVNQNTLDQDELDELYQIFQLDHINQQYGLHQYVPHQYGTEQDINQIDGIPIILLDEDSQNVHSREVNKTIRKIFDDVDISRCISNEEVDNLIQDINDYVSKKYENENIKKIKTDKDNNEEYKTIGVEHIGIEDIGIENIGTENIGNEKDERIEKINNVLLTIKNRNSYITNVEAKEIDVLSTIWNEANKKDNELSENIKDMLILQIMDSYENNKVVCPTGFVNRISTSLIVDTPESFPKTKEIIQAEMLNTASKIRSDLENDTKYKKLNDEDQSKILKYKIINQYNTDYQGILDKKEIDDIIKPWINYV